MMNNSPLTQFEQDRKDQILALALRAASRRRRKRLVARTAITCAILLPVAATVVWRFTLRPTIPVARTPPTSPQPVAPHQHTLIVQIPDDPTVVRRLTLPPTSNTIVRIGDDQLLKELASAHEPAGLAYVNGKAELIFQ